MKIRPYQPSDHTEIADLFHAAVHAIPETIYSKEERDAWAPTPPNYTEWASRLSVKKPFVAVKNNTLVGFIELEKDGHIDCLYVHPTYQRAGVASQLLQQVRTIADQKGLTTLTVEASRIAMPFFKQHGFTCLQKNIVHLRGQPLVNYSMSSCMP